MAYHNIRPRPTTVPPDPLERGSFSDGVYRYTVCASSNVAPDSFQVYAGDNRADLVLIVSGILARNLFATWGDDWRSRSEAWREWFRDTAFAVFYNGTQPARPETRSCNG